MSKKQLEEELKAHKKFWRGKRQRLKEMRAMFQHDWWPTAQHDVDSDFKSEHSLIEQWAKSLLAGMFMQGISTHPRLSRVVHDKDPTDPEERREVAESFSLLLDSILNGEDLDVLLDNGMIQGIVYLSAGLKVRVDKRAKHPVDRLVLEPIPGWEIITDPFERNLRDRRFLGHMYQIHIDHMKARGWVGGKPGGDEPTVSKESLLQSRHRRRDFIEHGWNTTETEGEKRYHTVIEWYDLVEDKHDIYLVNNLSDCTVTLLKHAGPVPNTWPDGTPMSPIEHFVLAPEPEHPNRVYSSAGSIYQLNVERNWLLTMAAESVRLDQQKALLVKSGLLNEEQMRELRSGKRVVLEVDNDGEGPISHLAHWLHSPAMSPSIMQHLQVVQQAQQDSQGLSNTQQGKSVDYASATEIMALTRYSESMLGMIRRRLDKSVNRFAIRVARVLHDELNEGQKIKIDVGHEIREYGKKELSLHWDISFSDIAATPVGKSQARAQLKEVIPMYNQLLGIAASPDEPPVGPDGAPAGPATPPEQRRAAQILLDKLIELYELPDELRFRNLAGEAPDDGSDLDAMLGEETVPSMEQIMAAIDAAGGGPIDQGVEASLNEIASADPLAEVL